MSKNLPNDLEQAKRSLEICQHLEKLRELFDDVTLQQLRALTAKGSYLSLYRRLLIENNSQVSNPDLIRALILAGTSADLTPEEIASDMA